MFSLIERFNKKKLYKIHDFIDSRCTIGKSDLHLLVLTCTTCDLVPFLEVRLGNKSWKYKFKIFYCLQTGGGVTDFALSLSAGTNRSLLWRSGVSFITSSSSCKDEDNRI